MRGVALLVTLLLTLVVVVDRPRAGTGSGRDGRIAVVAGESGDTVPTPRLFVMNGDGTQARVRLGWILHASLSPDGRLIAYDSRTIPPQIWVAPFDGRGAGRLLVRNGTGVDWSHTGGAVAFVRYRHGCCQDPDLWIENLRSGREQLLVRDAGAPDWSPDAKKLAFVRGNGIWVVDMATKTVRRIIRSGYAPRWSPEGGRIAFVRERGFDSFVYAARADGKEERRVAEGDSAAWSPDGTELAITEFSWILRVHVDGSHRRVAWTPKYGCQACRDVDWVG
jgi:Tol biopolymer transport system component